MAAELEVGRVQRQGRGNDGAGVAGVARERGRGDPATMGETAAGCVLSWGRWPEGGGGVSKQGIRGQT